MVDTKFLILIAAGESSEVPIMNPGQTIRSENDHYLPLATIKRIMRQILPSNARIADDAKEIVQECVSEFIEHVTNVAKKKQRKESRETMKAEDLIWAMNILGMDNYAEALSYYLNKMRSPNFQPVSIPDWPTNYSAMSFGQPDALAARPSAAVSYGPMPSIYPVDLNYYVPSSQGNDYYMYNVGGNGGNNSSENV